MDGIEVVRQTLEFEIVLPSNSLLNIRERRFIFLLVSLLVSSFYSSWVKGGEQPKQETLFYDDRLSS